MGTPIHMPKYGHQQDEGTVVRWLKHEGEEVLKGEVLLELETDKASFEYEAPESGFLRKIVADDGTVVPVNSVIAIMTKTAEEPFEDPEPYPAPTQDEAEEPEPPGMPGATNIGDRVKCSPAARRRARDMGVDLTAISGTGPGGRITVEDIEQAGADSTSPAEKPSAESAPLSRMRQAIGRQMLQSKQTIPHFYVNIEIDMTDVEAWRTSATTNGGQKLSVTDLLIKASATTILQFPRLNARLDGDNSMIEQPFAHVGLAIGLDDGLLVPVLANIQDKRLGEIADERTRAVELARQGRIQGTTKATFTLSNLGMFGVTSFTAIINPPECTSLAVGATLQQVRPFGETGDTAIRKIMNVTLSADHRLADGMLAAQYLQALKRALEDINIVEDWT